MSSRCQLCGSDLSDTSIRKIVGRPCCSQCAVALFDAALAAKKTPGRTPLLALRDDLSRITASARSQTDRRGRHLDYYRGQFDAHSYDLALVYYAIAETQKKPAGAPS